MLSNVSSCHSLSIQCTLFPAFYEVNNNTQLVTRETSPGVFDIPRDPFLDPRAEQNLAAAVVNAFYVANAIHDISVSLACGSVV